MSRDRQDSNTADFLGQLVDCARRVAVGLGNGIRKNADRTGACRRFLPLLGGSRHRQREQSCRQSDEPQWATTQQQPLNLNRHLVPSATGLCKAQKSFAEPHPPVGSLVVSYNTATVVNLYGAAMAPTDCRALAGTRSARIGHVAIIPGGAGGGVAAHAFWRRQRIERMMRSTDTLFGTSPCITAAACQVRYHCVACSISGVASACGMVARKLGS
jgi:hypothetical protein